MKLKILLQKKFCFKRKFLLTYFRQIKSLDPSLISFIFPKKIDSNGWTIDKQVRDRKNFLIKSIWTNIITNYTKKVPTYNSVLLWCFFWSEMSEKIQIIWKWNKYKIGETFESIYKVFSFLYYNSVLAAASMRQNAIISVVIMSCVQWAQIGKTLLSAFL